VILEPLRKEKFLQCCQGKIDVDKNFVRLEKIAYRKAVKPSFPRASAQPVSNRKSGSMRLEIANQRTFIASIQDSMHKL